ncbi:unnamed protein product, partial [Meganyctiphanes norvegica]
QYNGESLLSDRACNYLATLRYTLTNVEIQTISAIALTRCLVVYCSRARLFMSTRRFVIGYLIFIWLYSFSLKFPTFLGIFGKFKYNRKTMECDMSKEKLPRFVALVVEAVLPVFFIFTLYILIIIKV